MKLFFKITHITLVVLGIFVVMFLIWYYPIQRFLALKDFNKYITAQGTNKSNIQSIRVLKNYKQDGYYIDVFYFDDPEIRYHYKWATHNCYKDTFNIFLIIYKNNECIELLGIEPKYPDLNKK